MGRVYNPIERVASTTSDHPHNMYQLKNQDSRQQLVIAKPSNPRPSFPLNNLPKSDTSLVRPDFQSTTNTRPIAFIPEEDQVVYPQTPSLLNYYKTIQQITNRYFPNSSSFKNLQNPITFPDEQFDERRLKRSSNNMTNFSDDKPSPSTSDEENVGIRLKDPLWFNKPTASEVIIPINANANPEVNRSPEPAIPTFDKPSKPNETSSPETIVSFARPQLPQMLESTTTGQSSTTPPNIFHALTPSPNYSPVFPGSINNGWNPNNEQNASGQEPGFPPIGILGPNSRPVFISPPWFPNKPNPYFQSLPPGVPLNQFPPGSGSGIFFPEYRFSSRN